uniref:glycoside hydrolase family 15 protein n=1 Tax=Allokutzneria albata TaxID=211114 RepID=UPI0004C2F7D1
ERNGLPLGQRYLPGTMTVETRWSKLLVTDYLDHYAPPHRTDIVRVISGNTRAVIDFAPRPEFGQVAVKLAAEPDGLRVLGTSDPIVLRAPGVEWTITSDGQHESAQAVVEVTPDQPIVTDWLATLKLPEVQRDLVARSALTLKGLQHDETGAFLAAATTSLPEEIGGVRNWDYRYCWIRDAALSAQALVRLGSTAEAEKYLSWVHGVLATLPGPERLHPLYTLHGTHLGPEAVIDTQPDHGIWEERAAPRHRVYSKVMCWVTLDRAIKLAEAYGRPADPSWPGLRDTIRADVLENGWNEEVQSYATAYDGPDLDAATLHIGLSGLIDPQDERFQATVTATEAEL